MSVRLRRLCAISVLLAVATFVFTSLLRQVVTPSGVVFQSVFYPFLWHNTPGVVLYYLVWVGLAAFVTYRGGGLRGSWVIVFGPLFGGIANDFVLGNVCCAGAVLSRAALHASYSTNTHLTNTALAGVAALAITLILGTAGHLIGTGAKQLVETPE